MRAFIIKYSLNKNENYGRMQIMPHDNVVNNNSNIIMIISDVPAGCLILLYTYLPCLYCRNKLRRFGGSGICVPADTTLYYYYIVVFNIIRKNKLLIIYYIYVVRIKWEGRVQQLSLLPQSYHRSPHKRKCP